MMPPRNQDRSITTCRSCRRRKIRCDRMRPRCNRCRESGAACVYEDQVPQPAPTYQFVSETPGTSAADAPRPSGGAEPSPAITISADRLQKIETRVETLTQMVRTLQAHNLAGSAGSYSVTRSTTDVSSASIQEPEPSNNPVGHLARQNGGVVRYVDPSFWASMCQEVAELDHILLSQARLPEPADVSTLDSDDGEGEETSHDEEGSSESKEDGAGALDESAVKRPSDTRSQPGEGSHSYLLGDLAENPPTFSAGQATASVSSIPSLLQQLPSKASCDLLVESYVRGYHPIVPLVHVPTFRHRSEDFWQTHKDPGAASTAFTSFATLLLAICYAGSVASPDSASQAGPEPEEVSIHLHKLGFRGLRLASFPQKPTLDTFIAYLVLQSTWMREEEPLNCVAFVGLAIRIANMLGLHKDPSHFGSTLSPIEAETRRRVWWHVVHIDVLVAVASGLPPLIDIVSWDVQGISELKEEFIGTPVDDPQSPSNMSMVSTAGILAAGKLRYTLVLRRALAKLFTGGPLSTLTITAMRNELRLLGEDLASRISRIPEPSPESIRMEYAQGTYENNLPLNRWARLLLSAYIDERYCLVSHPTLKAPVSEIWPDLYSQSIEACQSYCMKCAQLCSVEDFRFFNWSWPGNHQPLHAIMILLIDLIQTPDAPYASYSRRVVDIIFALLGPSGGLIAGAKRPLNEGGRETWEYLRRLRIRAWQECGADPGLAWTREQAIQHCNKSSEPQALVPDLGPMWSQASPDMSESMGAFLESTTTGFENINDVMMSPPTIDFPYLEAILGGESQFDIGEDEGPSVP